MPHMPVFFYGKSFWKPLGKFIQSKMLPLGLVSKNDLKIYKLTDDLQEIVKAANKIGHPPIKTNYYDGFTSAAGFQQLPDDEKLIK